MPCWLARWCSPLAIQSSVWCIKYGPHVETKGDVGTLCFSWSPYSRVLSCFIYASLLSLLISGSGCVCVCVYALVLCRICVVFVCMCVAYPELHVLCCALKGQTKQAHTMEPRSHGSIFPGTRLSCCQSSQRGSHLAWGWPWLLPTVF